MLMIVCLGSEVEVMYHIMIIEDDTKLRSAVTAALRKWQFEVVEVTEFAQILTEFREVQPDLVLLDINLPVNDGFYWCQQIRTVSKVPVIFLSSRNQNMDIIMAIHMGGDDFLQKPFDLDVLVAKIQALLRRNNTYQDTQKLQMAHRGLTLHLTDSSIENAGERVELSRNELVILQLLLRNVGKIVSREDLMHALWSDEQFVDDNTLTVNVNRLRRKIAGLGLTDFIATRKGMGYLIA